MAKAAVAEAWTPKQLAERNVPVKEVVAEWLKLKKGRTVVVRDAAGKEVRTASGKVVTKDVSDDNEAALATIVANAMNQPSVRTAILEDAESDLLELLRGMSVEELEKALK